MISDEKSDLIKLVMVKTNRIVGRGWREYALTNVVDDMEINAILLRSEEVVPESLEMIMVTKPPIVSCCTATFHDYGDRKISVIKAVREITAWGLRESKTWVEKMPHAVVPNGFFSRRMMLSLVTAINEYGGHASMNLGQHCEECNDRFKCFTER